MSKPKIIIAALILALGLTGAYFIISNYNSTKPAEKNIIIEETIGNNPVGIVPAISDTQNLTNLLTKKIEESIAAKNTEGFNVIDGKTLIAAPKPETIVEDLLLEAGKNFDPASLIPKINDSSIKISEDSGKEALSKYFVSLSNIITSASKNIPVSLYNADSLSVSDISKTKQVYDAIVSNVQDLTVPRLVLDIHRKELELLTTKRNIYEKMANLEQDPVTAYLVIDELLRIDQEFAILKTEVKKFFTTYLP
ncbi:MAG: hypothetical protein Q7S81_00060 [bacterium]|nr:hypothetical protein [bacterium]